MVVLRLANDRIIAISLTVTPICNKYMYMYIDIYIYSYFLLRFFMKTLVSQLYPYILVFKSTLAELKVGITVTPYSTNVHHQQVDKMTDPFHMSQLSCTHEKILYLNTAYM